MSQPGKGPAPKAPATAPAPLESGYALSDVKVGGKWTKAGEPVSAPADQIAKLIEGGQVSKTKPLAAGEIPMPPAGVENVIAVVLSTLKRGGKFLAVGEPVELPRAEYVALARAGVVSLPS